MKSIELIDFNVSFPSFIRNADTVLYTELNLMKHRSIHKFLCWCCLASWSCSEIIITVWKLHCFCFCSLLLKFSDLSSINLDLIWCKHWSLNKRELLLVGQSSEEPDKWLFELIIALSWDIVVLEVLLSVEGDLLGLNLSVLHIDFVSDQGNWDVLAYSYKILVPLWNILVSDSWAYIKHDDTTVSTDVVTISQSTEFLLSCCIPDIEEDLALWCIEAHWMHLNTESGDVFLLEFTS